MRKLAVVLGISVLALVGCGEKSITEAEARIGGPVAEDYNSWFHGPRCNFDTSKLVIDMEEDIWLDRHAPICQDKGKATLDMNIPFVNRIVRVPADEVDQIERVDGADPEQFMEIAKIKVVD